MLHERVEAVLRGLHSHRDDANDQLCGIERFDIRGGSSSIPCHSDSFFPMLRFHPSRNAVAAQSYFTQGLAREDYYVTGQEIPGRWGGRAAETLGLLDRGRAGDVTRAAFLALTENRHPLTNQRLTLRTKPDRTVGYDLNFHAPKGVSLLHALHGDDRIVEAFCGAVEATMREIETDAAARVRKGGVQEDRPTGNLIWAEFVHFTARPTEKALGPDPHLHAHCFTFNATHDPVEGVWKAAQFRHLMRDAPYYEAAFHARFSSALVDLGYAVERTDTGWDLARLPRPLIEKFSSRTREIEAVAAELGVTDPKAKGQLGARTRKAKDNTIPMETLRENWDERLDDQERELLRSIADGAARTPPETPEDPERAILRQKTVAREVVDWAIDHCFERRSSLPERRLVAEALKSAPGRALAEPVWAEMKTRPWLSREIKGVTHVTTKETLAEEKQVVAFAVSGKNAYAPFAERHEALKGEAWAPGDDRLAPDQLAAVKHIMESSDRVMAVRGAAGTGKTTMMREAIAGIRASGRSVVVVAPTAEASRGEDSLRTKGFPGADTVARFLSNPDLQRGLANSSGGGVLWVDEAGLLGVKTMRRLFEVAEKHDARVVLSGDVGQHRSVEAGDALRILQTLGGVESAELLSIRRQQGLYRSAVADLAVHRVDPAVDKLRRLGAFHEIEGEDERYAAAAKDYVEAIESGRTSLVVSPTHAEGQKVAAAVRAEQRARGMIAGEDREYSKLRNAGYTEAERRDPGRYAEGMVAHFHKHAKGVVAGDKCTVVGLRETEQGRRVVRALTPRGVEIDLPLEHADRFQVFRAERIRLAVGDRVRLTRNGPTADGRGSLTNGMTGVVKGFTKHGAIKLQTGRGRTRLVPAGYGHLAYGSVMTSHAAQGKDVDRVILAQSSASGRAASAAQFYVSVSRGKKAIAIYTEDAAKLVEAVKRTSPELAAMELAETALESPGGLSLSRLQDAARRQSQERSQDRSQDQSRGGGPPARARKRGRGKDGPGKERDRER